MLTCGLGTFGWTPVADRRGFTLLECLVAMVIVGLGAAAALDATGSGLRSSAAAREALWRNALLQDRVARTQLQEGARLLHLPDSIRAGKESPEWHGLSWRTDVSQDRHDPELVVIMVEVRGPAGISRAATMTLRPDAASGRVGR